MYNYELVVVLDATRPEEEIREGLSRIRAILDEFKCDVTYVEEWGRRKMAFAIKNKVEGFYTVYYFRSPEDKGPAAELDRYARITDILLRHLIVRVPKLKTEADARREQAMREAEQAMREEQRAKAAAAAEAAREAEQAKAAAEAEQAQAEEGAKTEEAPAPAEEAAPEAPAAESAPAAEEPAVHTVSDSAPAAEAAAQEQVPSETPGAAVPEESLPEKPEEQP